MNSYLLDFLTYFFPSVESFPDWLQVFIGSMLLCLFLKIILSIIERR